MLLLDATKAFDRAHSCKLLKLLIDKGMSPLVIRLLIFMYTNQKSQVKWVHLHLLCMRSQMVFAVYVDGLFYKLKKSGVGCQMRNYFIGCLLLAYDVTLLCPTIKGFKKMIAICEEYEF